jgi:hypothetical protein
MAATNAAQTKIRTGPQDKPSLFAAGMLFFHNKYIIEPNIHGYLLGICETSPQ